MLSWLVIAFLPRSKHLLISWLQSPSKVILEPKKIKSATVSTFSPSICHEMMGSDAMILVTIFIKILNAHIFLNMHILLSSNSISVCVCVYVCVYMCAHSQSCLTLCDPMNYSLSGFSVHGIFQAGIPEWTAISCCRESSNPGTEPMFPALPALTGQFFTTSAIWDPYIY